MYDLINRAGRSRGARARALPMALARSRACAFYSSRISSSAAVRGETALNFHRAFYRRLSGLTGTFSSADDCATV
jgi:hypothetical protein